jgi:peptide-methionine (S)-S-oxide reductase
MPALPHPSSRRGGRRRAARALAAAAGLLALMGTAPAGASDSPEQPRRLPAPTLASAQPAKPGLETAVLSGGCFWGVQGVFQHVRGVSKVTAGYSGGAWTTAHYELVGSGTTGHAESIRIVFDPRVISYGEILRIFFSVATDPTQLNAQFPDRGRQYRSVIFYADKAQKEQALAYISQLEAAKAFDRPIVTRVDPLTGFYQAEPYHQDYLYHHPDAPYIATFDAPKLAALRVLFPGEYEPKPVLAY